MLLPGMRFGKLVIIKRCSDLRRNGRILYECKCDCGGMKYLTSNAFNQKHGTRSCGCMQGNGGRKARFKYGESSCHHLFLNYIRNAKRAGRSFELTEAEFKSLTSSNCNYCGCPPNNVEKSLKRRYGDYIYNGIDRVDNEKGYIVSNCVSCCSKCNVAKNKMTQREFLDWVDRVYHYQEHINDL